MKLPFCNVARLLRRLFWLCAGMLLTVAPAWAEHSDGTIRMGIPHSLYHMDYGLMADFREYLKTKLRRPVVLVMHRKGSDTTAQMDEEKFDFAWVTDYPHLHDSAHSGPGARLLAVPLYKGQPYYTSYLIVPAYNNRTTSMLQLKGAVFALADPNHNGNNLEVSSALLSAGEDPTHFFSKTIFVGSHIDVIKAVALGLVQAGEVESIVWEGLAKMRPDLAAQTRIVAKSPAHGAPPLVASHFVNKEDFNTMQRVLIGMSTDPKGKELLKRLDLDGFVPGDEKIYGRTIQMMQAAGEK